MKFLDEVKIFVKSGDGGNGLASFRREKFIEFGGPDGGNGGKGGDVYIIGKHNLNTLIDYRYKTKYIAQDGHTGGKSNCTGAFGEDLYLNVPLGTEVIDEQTGVLLYEIMHDEQKVLLFPGGRGGLGNSCFKSSTKQAPTKATHGRKGLSGDIILKLKIIADIGIVGKPNAGKSTFLSKISKAQPKVGNYNFTTLYPNLGVARIQDKELLFADIPGIIEGAHKGLGLGIKFLKHIERCRLLIHFIDINDEVDESFKIIRNEINEYNKTIKFTNIIILNKSDQIQQDEIDNKVQKIKKVTSSEVIFTMSAFNQKQVKEILNEIFKLYYK